MMKGFFKNRMLLIAVIALGLFLGPALDRPGYAEDNADPEDTLGMEQEAGTSGGTVKRHIDMSSPWSGAYLHENMTVVGKAEIRESFSMNNTGPGAGGSGETKFDTGIPGSGGEVEGAVSSGQAENPPSEGQDNPPAEPKRKPEIEVKEIPGWADLF